MHKRVFAAVAMLAVPTAPAVAAELTVAEFLKKADALQAKGPMAVFSGDLSLLKKEMNLVGKAYRADIVAAQKAGKPAHSCPPKKGSMTSDELLAEFRAIPPAQRGMGIKPAFYNMMKKRYPCRR